MRVIDLKKSLEKLGNDYDDAWVVLIKLDKNKKRECGVLAATGLINNFNAIFLADEDAAKDMLDKNTPTVDDWTKDLGLE